MTSNQNFDYDLLIIGAGSGGMAAAKSAAEQGVRVGVIEREAVGGTCANRGCVPKKMMFYAAEFAQTAPLAQSFAWHDTEASFHWNGLRDSIQSQLDSVRASLRDSIQEMGAELIEGTATFVDEHQISIQSETSPSRLVSAEYLLIAVGGEPQRLDLPGIELALTEMPDA